MTQCRIFHFLTYKLFGIDVHDRYSYQPNGLVDGAEKALHPYEVHLENEPTVAGWVWDMMPTARQIFDYLQSLIPSAQWLLRYNVRWLARDAVAGIAAGVVVVPQAMAIAALAKVPPEYGLYTSITSGTLYWILGTSRDVVVSTTAMGALLVGHVFDHTSRVVPGTYTPDQVATHLCMMTGVLFLFMGVFRLGWVIESIPYVPISAFITAASIYIIASQIPVVLGIKGVDTRNPPYLVFLAILERLRYATLDAAIGVPSIVLLFGIRSYCSHMAKKQPSRKLMWSRISSLRLTAIVALFTLLSYIIHQNLAVVELKFAILGHIDRGFSEFRVPRPDLVLWMTMLPRLPAVVIVLATGHISMTKAMGRTFNYAVAPSQELIALGAANLCSPFLGGIVCSASFGASAVIAESGVRTPFASIFSALLLVLSLYAFSGVFCYIPKATMASLLIHVVCSLISPPRILFRYWQLSPIELLIWLCCVTLAMFYSLELSIYLGLALSTLTLLLRLSRTRGRFLGLARVRRHAVSDDALKLDPTTPTMSASSTPSTRVVFIPLDRQGACHPEAKMETPYPGVFVYRFNEGFNYTNQAYHMDILCEHIMKNTRPTSAPRIKRKSDRLWNDGGPEGRERGREQPPCLRAMVLDFAAVNNTDVTSVQALVEVRKQFDRYAAPDAVEWHTANVHSGWTRRALAIAGFGFPSAQNEEAMKHWKPIYNVTPVGEKNQGGSLLRRISESWSLGTKAVVARRGEGPRRERMASIAPVDRPFFHVDLHDAVDCAVRGARSKDAIA